MKTLALCMIVKNEEQMLAGCLESIKDFVDEMIVVDTGSTDNTKQIALEHGAKVFDFEWINDFAAARNYAKAQTDCDYVIALDADERFNPQDGQKLRTELNSKEHMVLFVRLTEADSIQDNVDDVLTNEEAIRNTMLLPRILKNVSGNDWYGRVHEAPLHTEGAVAIHVNIVHLGADLSYRQQHNKSERNLLLLEEIVAESQEQFPLFFSYLALERRAVGDHAGFAEAVAMGWERLFYLLEEEPDKGLYNSGVLSTYPEMLLLKGQFVEGLQALTKLVQHLQYFSSNAANTLFQVLEACVEVDVPFELRDSFYKLYLDATNLLIEFDKQVFAEPTWKGVTTYKALQYQAIFLGRMKRFDEAFEALIQMRTFAEMSYAADLLELELLLEKGDMTSCLNIYTDILEQNLDSSPDIWVLGALILIVLNQEEDAMSYMQNAMTMSKTQFISRHRLRLLGGLHARMSLLNGDPKPGIGVYGVLGAILSRKPVQVTHQVPSTLIQSVVDRYVQLHKIEALLPFFDDRAEQILPGIGKLVQNRLEEYGVVLEDDGQKTPFVIVGRGLEELSSLFNAHSNMQIIEFSADEIAQITTDLVSTEDAFLDDLLFGGDTFGEDEEKLVVTKSIVQQKLLDVEGHPVILWNSEWPMGDIDLIIPEKRILFYLTDPTQSSDDAMGLYQWHLQNSEMFVALPKDILYLNALLIQRDPFSAQQDILAYAGVESIDQLTLTEVKCADLSEHFPSETDVALLHKWQFA